MNEEDKYHLDILSDIENGNSTFNYDPNEEKGRYTKELIDKGYIEGIKTPALGRLDYFNVKVTWTGRIYHKSLKIKSSMLHNILNMLLLILKSTLLPIAVSVVTTIVTVFVLRKLNLQ